jgi:hypothetical protein
MRGLLREHDLPEPDEILDHEEGGIVCLWHGRRWRSSWICSRVSPDGDRGGALSFLS